MNCSNRTADLLKALCAVFILLFSVNACTEVDDRLGSNLMPENQKMKVRIRTLEGVRTYLHKEDSVASSRLGYAYFGRSKDNNNVFGAQKNSFIVQFLPTSLPYEKGYGIDPIVDSICIVMPVSSVQGDTTLVQKFDVYEIKGPENLFRDSTYYASFPIDDYRKQKLFSFTHTGKRNVKARLFPTEAGKEYLQSIVTLDMDTYKDDSLFIQKYNGLYVTPTDDSPVNAAVYASNLASAGMILYARNHDTTDVSAIYDTVTTTFSFRDSDERVNNQTVKWRNVSVNLVDFDYTGSTLGSLQTATQNFTDTTETSPVQSLVYLQPMSGVTGYLRFTDELISTLRDLRNDVDDEGGEAYYPSIMINQAMMYIWLEDDSVAKLDSSMKRIGSYTDIKSLTAIPDYLYFTEYYERNRTNGDPDYTLPYNGYLNRSNGYYELDITSYVQQLAKGDPGDRNEIQPVIHIAPEAYGFFDFGNSVLKGYESDRPIEIRLTYTLIDGRDNRIKQ